MCSEQLTDEDGDILVKIAGGAKPAGEKISASVSTKWAVGERTVLERHGDGTWEIHSAYWTGLTTRKIEQLYAVLGYALSESPATTNEF